MIAIRPRHRSIVLVVAIGILTGGVFAQTPLPGEFERAMRVGRTAFDAGNFVEAQREFERALLLARAAASDADEGGALLALTDVHFVSSRYPEAKDAASRAIAIAEKLSDVLLRGRARYNLGIIEARLGHASESRALYEAAVADLSTTDDAGTLSMALLELIGAADDHPVNNPERYQQALELAERTGDQARIGRVQHAWGDRLFTVGENEAALMRYQAAVTAYTKANRSNAVGTVYNSIGRLYRRHEQIETALDYQKRALRIHEKGRVPFVHMQSLNAVGVTLQALGRWSASVPYLEQALDMARASKNPRAEDFVAGNLSGSLIVAGDFAQAARLLEGIIARKLDVYPSLRYYSLAEAYLGLNELDQALDAAEHAIATCGSRADLACIVAYDMRAAVYLARKDRAAALADLQVALEGIEDARKRLIPADFFKQQFGQSAKDLFGRTIELQLADGQVRDALDTAEQGRARAFMDLLASQNITTASDTAVAGDNTSQRRSELNAPPPKSDDLVAIATRLHSTLLVYWVASDRVFIWTVKANGTIDATTVKVHESKLASLVAATTPFAASSSAPAQAWRDLYDLLIKPVRRHLPAAPGALVTVVPHGPLAMLSFAALQNSESRYLVEDYTLHYAPAAGILQFTETRRQGAAASRAALIVADPQLPARSPLDRPLLALPGARDEARAIAGLTKPHSVQMLEGVNANEAAVRKLVAGKRVLHFATHAIVSDAEPFSSFLALARSDSSHPHDGTLTAQEIYELRLQAELVVLSACRSGGGRVTGDGLSTFARAFLAAGTPSMITSVWDVADESTSHLIPEFYRAWYGGTSKARALRAAQLKFLSELRKGSLKVETAAGAVVLPEHPALWAGFTLIGEPD